MWISVVDVTLTFASHAIAATHLSPLKHGKKRDYAVWIIWAVLFMLFSIFMPPLQRERPLFSAVAFISACVVHIVLYFLTTSGSVGERFFLLLSYAAFFAACCALTQFFEVFILPDNKWSYLIVYAILLGAMLWLFLIKLLPVFRESARYIKKKWSILSALMAWFLIALITWFLFPSHIGDFTIVQTSGLLALVTVMFVAYAVIFICIRNIANAERAKQMNLQLELLSTQVKAQSQAAEEARRIRHDLRHHNLMILNLAEQGNIEGIINYLQSVTSAEHYSAETVWCENDTISSILSVYSAKASKEGIKTDMLAQAEQNIGIAPPELVCIIANLFENAIHGASESAQPDPFIKLRIYTKSDKLVIRIENSCNFNCNFPDGFPIEKYGIGLLSVQKSVDAYGEMSLYTDDGVFIAFVLLNQTTQLQ